MLPLLERLRQGAARKPRRIVFPEGNDDRIIAAARRLKRENLAEPILIAGNPAATEGIEVISPETSPQLEAFAQHLHRTRASKTLCEEDALILARRPIFF